MNKAKIFAFALALGLGASLMVAEDAFARPNYDSCMQLKEQCEEGDARSCTYYRSWCLECELEPEVCGG